MPLQLCSPAKLNLMLHITGRRDDGYHLLETVFQFIDLCDHLEFDSNDDGSIRRLTGNTAIPEDDDITLTAARLLQSVCNTGMGVNICIDKQIPVGGGLGGGSSNAATCLLALNQLWNLGLSLDRLAELGLQLGADVPVFVHGHAAWATGVGECLTPVELEQPYYLVIHPKIGVSTAKIFSSRELTRNCDPITIRAFLEGSGKNVCEPVVCGLYPQVAEAIDWLSQFAATSLTGTGACLFAPFDSLEQADAVKSQVPERWDAQVAKGLNISPLHQQLGLL